MRISQRPEFQKNFVVLCATSKKFCMKNEKSRSPLDRAMPLRIPGQSIEGEIWNVEYDHVLSPLLLAIFMTAIALLEWSRYLMNMKLNPWVFTGAAVSACIYSFYRIRRIRERLRQLRLGRDGERAVAQYLEWFRSAGFFVFHDVPSGDANVDHVLIGPKGVFSIETKTWSKPRRGECKVTVQDGVIRANGRPLDRDPLVQAKAQAGWLRQFFAESQFKVSVQPVVVIPGWFVEPFDMKKAGAWVLEVKALEKFIDHEPDRLTRDEIKAMGSALSSYIRSQAKV
jgi:hypothetical protein